MLRLPKVLLSLFVVLLVAASAVVWLELRRQHALDILDAAGASCEGWKGPLGFELKDELDPASARNKWLFYPATIVTGDTGGRVNAANLGDAVAILKPDLLIIQIEYAMDTRCAERIASVKRLETLYYDNSWNVADEHIALLRGHPNLKDLALENSKVTAASFDVFASMPRLEVVRLNGTSISEEEREELRKRGAGAGGLLMQRYPINAAHRICEYTPCPPRFWDELALRRRIFSPASLHVPSRPPKPAPHPPRPFREIRPGPRLCRAGLAFHPGWFGR